MTISNSGSDERGRISGGKAGDQTGSEWRRRSWYQSGWDVILRHPDAEVREMIADMAGKAADNDNVGYDQGQRLTFYSKLKAAGWKPEKITAKCEADCSAGVTACVIGAGHRLGVDKLKAIKSDSYTGNMRTRFKDAGFTLLTASKYLTSDKYLVRGDILLNDRNGGHTCVNLTNGSKSGATSSSSASSSAKKTVEQLAAEVIDGKWGNGSDRVARLKAAGYDAAAVQAAVNAKLSGKKTVDQIAREVIDGKWGNGDARKQKLKAAGYDYSAVQNRVNEILS